MARSYENKEYLKRLEDFQKKYQPQIYQTSDKYGSDIGVATDQFINDAKKNGTSFGGIDRATVLNDAFNLRDFSTYKPPKEDTRTTRQRLLDPVKQATAELAPKYDRILGQLRESIASTRQAIPQALSARGQAVGGLRSAQETGLSRQEAFQTADIEAQRAGDILSRASEIEAGRKADEQMAFERNMTIAEFEEQKKQSAISNSYTLRQIETKEKEVEYQQFRDTIEDEKWQMEFDRKVAVDGVDNAIKWAQLEIQKGNLAVSQGNLALNRDIYNDSKNTTPDVMTPQEEAGQFEGRVRDLMKTDPQSALAYMNNLGNQGLISPQGLSYLKALVGTVPTTTTVTQPPKPAGEGVVTRTDRTTTPESIITPNVAPPVDTKADLNNLYINIENYKKAEDYESAETLLDGNMDYIIATYGYPEWVKLRKAAGLE